LNGDSTHRAINSEQEIALREIRTGHIHWPMRWIVLTGNGNPAEISTWSLAAKEPGDLIRSIQHL
jgi:hypothetical protein